MASRSGFVISTLLVVTLVHLSLMQVNATLPPECQLPSEQGMCRGLFPKFFYNTMTGNCERFFYGGCGGNANNYISLDACRRRCMGVHESNPTFTYDHTDVCQQPVNEGELCDDDLQRFYYNTAQRACLNFTYYGCYGNDNNFPTREACEERCSSNDRDYGSYDNSDICMFPPETGFCRGYSEAIFYNRHSGQCETFVYGLCGGNENRFNDEASCQARCGGAGVIGGYYPNPPHRPYRPTFAFPR